MYVFDLDGTLRDVTSGDWLVPSDITRTENWVTWQKWVNWTSKPHWSTVEMFNLVVRNHVDTVILTSSQFGTLDWCLKHGVDADYSAIYERRKDDHRGSFQYKKDFIDKHLRSIELWVDDDTRVCEYAKSVGIPVINVKFLPTDRANPCKLRRWAFLLLLKRGLL